MLWDTTCVHTQVCVCVYVCMNTCVLVLIRKTSNQIYFLQNNQTPFDVAVDLGRSTVVSLFVNKYKVDIKQYNQVTKVHSKYLLYNT